MITGFSHLHNVLRWVVLILLIWAIVKGIMAWTSGKKYDPKDRKPFLFTLIASHVQLVLGLVLYLVGPWRDVVANQLLETEALARFERFWKMEHITLMLLAIVLITLGHSRLKKDGPDTKRYRSATIMFIVALLMILAAIPWPFWGEPVARGLFPGQ